MISQRIDLCIFKVRSAHQDNIASFLFGKSHDLAFSLWQANDRKGVLLAGFRQKLGWRDALSLENYSYMVYQSIDGETWDIQGSGAIERWEKRWIRYSDSFAGQKIKFRWEEVNPEKIKEWVDSQDGHSFCFNFSKDLVAIMD